MSIPRPEYQDRRASEGGFALLLALFAVLALTVMAVAALTVANTDLVVSQNHRKRITTYKTAISGLDEARNFMRRVTTDKDKLYDLTANWQDYSATSCYPLFELVADAAWASPPPFDTQLISGNMNLGTPEACISKNIYFSGAAPGYSMQTGTGGGGARQYQMVSLDIRSSSSGAAPTNLTRSQVGGMVSFVCEAPCGR